MADESAQHPETIRAAFTLNPTQKPVGEDSLFSLDGGIEDEHSFEAAENTTEDRERPLYSGEGEAASNDQNSDFIGIGGANNIQDGTSLLLDDLDILPDDDFEPVYNAKETDGVWSQQEYDGGIAEDDEQDGANQLSDDLGIPPDSRLDAAYHIEGNPGACWEVSDRWSHSQYRDEPLDNGHSGTSTEYVEQDDDFPDGASQQSDELGIPSDYNSDIAYNSAPEKYESEDRDGQEYDEERPTISTLSLYASGFFLLAEV
ncbi:hypothetical protein V5O48_016063 [Marasmius crinis-equi]|uniref:Uncharacterized protein n=1 Tax=Marasmius crinis-equi TaxID=585013 RepID=A0ABR3ET27_9AGAR